jgi:2-(1,2-epoxy-1,2-dihydrophenyl)acetyl-CoA isomerase
MGVADDEVLVARDGAVATLTLNRPDRYNALTTSLRSRLRAELELVAADDGVRAVVLTGAGRAFCSGQDLKEFAEVADVRTAVREQYNPIIELLTGMAKPVIAAVNGPCAGAGLGFALACDVRLVADEGFLSCAFVGIGLVPDSGTSWFLTRMIGYQRALELACTGRRVGAEEACALGLALDRCPAAEIGDRAAGMAAALAAGPTRAIGLTKQLVREAQDGDLGTLLEREAELQVEAIATADHREGVAAFLEKRPPVFRGS